MNKFSILILVVCCAGLSGCNTMGGIGSDIGAAGDGIKRASGK